MIRKQIARYSNRSQINIGINELTDEKEVVLYTLKEHQDVSYKLSTLNKEIESLKQENKDKDIKINEHETNLKTSVEDAVSESNKKIEHYQDVVSKLNDNISERDEVIKAYQDEIKSYQESKSKYENEITSYKLQLSDMINLNTQLINQYNNLRTEVSRISRLDALFNRQKDILIQYPKLHNKVDELIDTTITDDTDWINQHIGYDPLTTITNYIKHNQYEPLHIDVTTSHMVLINDNVIKCKY